MTTKINDELKVTKSTLVFGALNVFRLQTFPPDTFGRNGDLVIVDDTTESVEKLATKRVPTSVRFCQRIATPVSGGTFTIDDGTTIFTITISDIDDVVEQVNRANIPAFKASIKDRGLIVFEGIPVTFADGTSDFPSATGIAGAFGGGKLEIPTGSWESFVTSAAGGLSYGAVSGGDGGTAFAIVSGDLITYSGTGINVVAVNAGLGLDTVDFTLDIADLTAGVGPLILSDEIGVNDSGTTLRFTFTDVVEDLDIPNAITTDGIITRTAADTYTSRSIISSTTAGLEGADVVNGDGVSGNPEIGIDIDNLISSVVDLAASDELIVFDGTNNLSYTGQQIADGVSTIVGGFVGIAYGSIAGDVGTATATTSTELITFGGTGIAVTATNAGVGLDTVAFDLDISDLPAGVTVALSNEIGVDQGASPNVRFTFTDVVEDLDIPFGITTNGIITRTGSDTYASRSIVESTTAGQEGAQVNNGDGVAGNIEIGVDINNLANSANDLASTDELIVYDGTNNVSMSGSQAADGVATQLGITGLTFSTIDGESVLTFIDSTRASKVLSIETVTFMWAENRIGNDEWVDIGSAVDASSGYIMPHDATVVKVEAHTSDNNGNSKDIDLFADGALISSAVVSFTGGSGEDEFISTTVNIDVDRGEKIRLRGDSSGGTIDDTVITLFVKWRA